MPRFIHPLTQLALEPLYVDRHGRPHYPIMGGAPDGGDGDQGQSNGQGAGGLGQQGTAGQPPAGQQPADTGFPANTPVADMSAEQQAAYWKHQARKHEDRSKGREDYDQVKAELEQLRQQHMSESDKAIEAARNEGRTAALRETNKGTVLALLDGALRVRGRSDEQITEALKYVNTDAFVTNDAPDTKAILTYVETLAGPGTGQPDYGAGNRGGRPGATGRDAGLAEAQRRGYVKA